MKMTEFKCSCHIENKSIQFETMAAVTATQAFEQFRDYIERSNLEFELLDGLIIDRVEVDE